MYCVATPPGCPPTTDEDVHKLAKYQGHCVFQGSVRNMLNKKDRMWAAEITDMVAKAATSKLCGPKLEKLQEMLSENGNTPSAAFLRSMKDLFEEVSKATLAGVRGQFHQKLMEAFGQTRL